MVFNQNTEYTLSFNEDELDVFLEVIKDAYEKQNKIGFKKTFSKKGRELVNGLYNTFFNEEESTDTE